MSQRGPSRQKKAEDIAVPAGSKDAAERKRVLNVLAQRRYRKKKREHLKALESKLQESVGEALPEASPRGEELYEGRGSVGDGLNGDRVSSESNSEWLSLHESHPPPDLLPDSPRIMPPDKLTTSLPELLVENSAQGPAPSYQTTEPTWPEALQVPPQPIQTASQRPVASGEGSQQFPNCGSFSDSSAWPWDPTLFTPSINLDFDFSSTPDLTSSESSGTPSTQSSHIFSPHPQAESIPSELSTALQTHQTTHTAFADTTNLRTPELALLRAFFSIADVFQIANLPDLVWSFSASSPFYHGSPEPAPALPPNLPKNLYPTPVQRNIPHHPLLDLLPWPAVRNKLIMMFSAPVHQRPANARSPMALLEFAYDIEDSAEPVQVWGESPFEEGNWEVGAKVFRRWWWAFDHEIVKRSDGYRVARGEPRLGTVLELGDGEE